MWGLVGDVGLSVHTSSNIMLYFLFLHNYLHVSGYSSTNCGECFKNLMLLKRVSKMKNGLELKKNDGVCELIFHSWF